ncbi:multicopper oxidase [Rhodoglobus vestalii]|uniref:Multicopper oxidase n=1 Tax=Rhodoglobus vestalii TaxID=193384 RepID=A0A8H2K5J0_9MICO|nr:multicopper oxidase domain-containing protein [Rhodoglobus vestalii]TQO19565.1 multicopper oxidase [Rhodoglobus vestalii]
MWSATSRGGIAAITVNWRTLLNEDASYGPIGFVKRWLNAQTRFWQISRGACSHGHRADRARTLPAQDCYLPVVMWGYGNMGWAWGYGLLTLASVALLSYVIVRLVSNRSGIDNARSYSRPADSSNAKRILEERFARGELTAELRSVNGALAVALKSSPQQVTIAGRNVQALSYNGGVPGPMLHVCAGDTLSVSLRNGLKDPSNLQVHGLHVSPEGISDNVSVTVEAGDSFDYQYELPANHPPGVSNPRTRLTRSCWRRATEQTSLSPERLAPPR